MHTDSRIASAPIGRERQSRRGIDSLGEHAGIKTPAQYASWSQWLAQTISRTLSDNTVQAILLRLGSPRASDWAKCVACSSVIFAGAGGVNGSTTASTITGPFDARA